MCRCMIGRSELMNESSRNFKFRSIDAEFSFENSEKFRDTFAESSSAGSCKTL